MPQDVRHRGAIFSLSPATARRSLYDVMSTRSMTTANKVTILRMLLIPFFVVEALYYVKTGKETFRLLATLAFAIAAICDGVDGYIARHYNQRSELGAILDPLADKLLLVSGIVLFTFDNSPHFGSIPLWLTGTIIGRDLIILIGYGVIHATIGKVKVRPHFVGKIATVLQMLCVIWILLKWDAQFSPVWFSIWTLGAGICTGISGLLYVWDGMRQLSSHPNSSASTDKE
jgi:CDP-diacylglycerol--glycerol-3-phosphate 3-phosphatidyltransferase